MALPFHIFVALSSLVYATYLYFSPSLSKLRVSYTLVGLTLISGTYLVMSKPAHLLQACLTGLVYLGVVSVAIALARHKLSVLTSKETPHH